MKNSSVKEKVQSVIADENLVLLVANAASVDQLKTSLAAAGITGYDDATIELSFRNLSLGKNSLALLDLFEDHSYYSCKRKLNAMDIETNPAEYDLIRDVLDAAHDDLMGPDMDSTDSVASAAEVLMAYGHYHISETFLGTMLQYCTLLDEEGIFTDEDYREMHKCTFEQRCIKYISKLQAIGIITGLRYGIHDSFEIPYLIAIAGGAAMIRQRQEEA